MTETETGQVMTLPDLSAAPWLQEPGLQAVLGAIAAAGGQARVVGGAVRNELMGEAVNDVDLATDLEPSAVMAAAKGAGLRAVPTGIEHGTVTLVHARKGYEVTTLRRDIEHFGRRAKVTFTRDWAEDAARRDFTINALYCEAGGKLHDPMGGYDDLKARKVRFIGDAAARIREDYLRALRFFRFFAQYADGPIDADGLEACRSERKGLRKLSAERIFHEMVRLLAAPRADEAGRLMSENGIFIGADMGRARPEYLEHLVRLEAALKLDPDPVLRLWMLLGGGSSPDSRAESLAGRLRVSSKVRSRLQVLAFQRKLDPTAGQTDRRAALYALGAPQYREQVLMNWVAAGAAPDDADWAVLFRLAEQWDLPDFPIKGADVVAAGVPPGARVGKVLKALELWWIATGFTENRDEIDAQLKMMVEAEEG